MILIEQTSDMVLVGVHMAGRLCRQMQVHTSCHVSGLAVSTLVAI